MFKVKQSCWVVPAAGFGYTEEVKNFFFYVGMTADAARLGQKKGGKSQIQIRLRSYFYSWWSSSSYQQLTKHLVRTPVLGISKALAACEALTGRFFPSIVSALLRTSCAKLSGLNEAVKRTESEMDPQKSWTQKNAEYDVPTLYQHTTNASVVASLEESWVEQVNKGSHH